MWLQYHTCSCQVHQCTHLSTQSQEDATMACWSLPCCKLFICAYCTSVNTALFRLCKNLQNKGWRKEEYCSSSLYFSDTGATALKKTKGLTFTIHKFCRNRDPGSEAAGVKEYRVHHLLTLVLKGECQRQILPVRTECPREVSGSGSFAAWIR